MLTPGIIDERMGLSDDTELVSAWRELLEQHASTTASLERRLQHEHGLGVSEYEVLERLAGGDKDGSGCSSSPTPFT